MGDAPFGSSARLSGDFDRSFERERERLEGMLSESCSINFKFNVAKRRIVVDGY